MNYYLLENILNDNYDICQAKVVRASSEEEARKLANERVGDEGRIWEDPILATCQLLDPTGPAEEILSDYRHG